jgi:hypothetical protein
MGNLLSHIMALLEPVLPKMAGQMKGFKGRNRTPSEAGVMGEKPRANSPGGDQDHRL